MSLKNKIYISTVGALLSTLLRVINSTLKWDRINLDSKDRFWTDKEPTIMVFWHGQQLLMPWAYSLATNNKNQKPLIALISEHQDGKIAAKALEYLNIQCVHGSSSRNGSSAFRKLRKKLKEGNHIAITPDGPVGPIYKAKSGAIKLAQLSGAKLLPIAIKFENNWVFNSWDKMSLPKPFSKATMLFGKSYKIPAKLTKEETDNYVNSLESELNKLSKEANINYC